MPSGAALLRAYSVVGLAATVLAVRRAEPARLFAIRFPGSVAGQALTVGTGLSAPLPVLAAMALRGSHLDRRTTAASSALFAIGALGEPVTWRSLRSPGADPALTAVAALNVVLPAAALLRARVR